MSRLLVTALLSLVATTAFAQDGKPTQAQTIDYIQSKYPPGIEYSILYSRDDVMLSCSGEITGLSVNITGSKVVVAYSDVRNYRTMVGAELRDPEVEHLDYQITFDLKDIEAIDVGTRTSIGMITYEEATPSSAYPLYLIFRAANDKSVATVTRNGESKQANQAWIPIGLDLKEDNHRAYREFKDWQLYKAFDHLRKLSGAPEPLRF